MSVIVRLSLSSIRSPFDGPAIVIFRKVVGIDLPLPLWSPLLCRDRTGLILNGRSDLVLPRLDLRL